MSDSDITLNTTKFFIALLDDVTGEAKKREIIKYLDEGANVNGQFLEDYNNTPLHISIMNKDLELTDLLLRRGAKCNLKNLNGKTALDVAKELDADIGTSIINLIEAFESENQVDNETENANEITDISLIKYDKIDPDLLYIKRSNKSGIKGQFYESKLLSLVLIRGSITKRFDEFYLGTSLDGIGALDDICIRYKEDNSEGAVFLQAKHRSDAKKGKITLHDLWKDEGDFSLPKYYNSFLQIKSKFWNTNDDDVFFKGKYNDLKLTLVIYTTAESDFDDKKLFDTNTIDKTARDLICSGEYSNIYRYKYSDSDLALLTKMLIIEHMKHVGQMLVHLIVKGKYDMLLNDRIMRKYHVQLARKVINVSDITPGGYRTGTFREQFFKNQSKEWLLALKLILHKEYVLSKKINETKMLEIINAVKINPTEESVSKMMQNILTKIDENNDVIVIDERFKDNRIRQFRVNGNHMDCCVAFDMAIYVIFGKISFKLPSTFGNIDVAVANGKKGEKRLIYLAEKIEQYKFDKNKPVDIEPSLLDLNGGLGSAVGNLLVLDEKKEHFILNTDKKSLGKNAKRLLENLESKVENLDVVKFNADVIHFPYLTLDEDEMDNRNVRSFFDNLWFYTCQSKEDEVEEHAKDAILDYCIVNKYEYSQTSSNSRYDAIYFIIHDAVQKWWMSDEKSHYLTNKKDFLDKLFADFSGKSLLNTVSSMFINRMRKYDIKFNNDAIECLRSLIRTDDTILITDVSVLTGIKMAQCFQNLNNFAFIDLNYAMYLSKNDYKCLIKELKVTKLRALIVLYEDVSEVKTKIFFSLTDKSVTKNYILVTNDESAEKLQPYIHSDTFSTVRDVRNDLNDLDLLSQKKVLDNMFIFQGLSTTFSSVITHETKNLIRAKILQKIITNEIINIGKILTNPYYEDIKDYYIPRRLRKQNSQLREIPTHPYALSSKIYNDELIEINTLDALKDTVIIEGAPGIGKSSLLTNISIETKQRNPSIWIERINLLDRTKELHILQQQHLQQQINKIEALKFVCTAVLSKSLIRFCIKPKPLIRFDLEINNGELLLKNCDETDVLVWFELEMFIHCYNQGNTILLFDGFDEICPHYKKETLEILKCLVTRCSQHTDADIKQRMWITGRSYNKIKEALDPGLSVTYSLEMFNNEELDRFMKKYFEINVNLNDLDLEQFNRIDGFFSFMKQFGDNQSSATGKKMIKISSLFLYSLYKAAMKYFYFAINNSRTPENTDISLKWSSIFNAHSNFKFNEGSNLKTPLSDNLIHKFKMEEAIDIIHTPLHIYIVLDYFQNQIKNVKSDPKEESNKIWDLEMNTSSFYEHFLETKLKKIRFEEQNQMDLYNPDIIMTCEKEIKEFMSNHKKIAFYGMFKDNLKDMLTEEEQEQILEIIQDMKEGREKTGIVDCILPGDIPKFVHISFQHYFAAEYIADLFKNGHKDQMKLWKFILENINDGILEFFDLKLELDKELTNIVKDSDVKRVISNYFFNLICTNNEESNFDSRNVFQRAIDFGFRHITIILIKAVTDVVDEKNLDKFIAFTNKLELILSATVFGWDDVLLIILDCVRKVDASKLENCNLGISKARLSNYCNRDIIRNLKWKMYRFAITDSKTKGSEGRRNSV